MFEYFLKPLFRVLLSTIISVITFNLEEIKANLFFRLPFVFIVGSFLAINDLWFNWYKLIDLIQMNVFSVFDPSSTVKRILKNPFCSNDVIVEYNNYINSPKFRHKRVKFSLQ